MDAYNAVKRRILAEGLGSSLRGKFQSAPRSRVAGIVANNLISIDGKLYDASLEEDAQPGGTVEVVNIGRPGVALYAPKDGGGTMVVSGGSSGGGSGGTTTVITTGGYTAGDGIDITGTVISVDVTEIIATSYGLSETAGGNLRINNGNGLTFSSGALVVNPVADGGIDVGASGVSVDVSDDFAWTGTHSWTVDLSVDANIDFVGAQSITTSAGDLTLAPVGDLVVNPTGGELRLDGDLYFVGAQAIATTAGDLSLTPVGDLVVTPTGGELRLDGDLYFVGAQTIATTAGNLTIDPAGNVVFPNAQELRANTFSDIATGITGWRWWERETNFNQLTIGGVKVDELYARVFVADEVRIDRGEEFWSKSFGVVAEAFDLPADEATVDVWFEDAAGLAGANLFSVDDWLLIRGIDWGTSLTIYRVWFQVVSKLTDGGPGTPSEDWQEWRIRRKAGGTTGLTIEEGAVALDFGQSGQGYVHLSALEQDGGPFIQFGDWSSDDPSTEVVATPNANVYVRIGNLNGLANLSSDTWGLLAGHDFDSATQSDWVGIVASESGIDLYNTDILLYSSTRNTVEITSLGGMALGFDVNNTAGGGTERSFYHCDVYNADYLGSGRAIAAGDVVLGNWNAGHIWWDRSYSTNTGRLYFRDGSTTRAYVDTDGTINAGSGDVILDDHGITIGLGDAFDGTAALRFGDSTTTIRGSIYTRYVTGSHYQLVVEAGDGTTYDGQVRLVANTLTGTSDIHMIGGAGTSISDALAVSGTLETTGTVTVGSDLKMPNNYGIDFLQQGSTTTYYEAMRLNSSNNLVIGRDVPSGGYISMKPNDTNVLWVHPSYVQLYKNLRLDADDSITSAPPTAGTNYGWKMSLYSTTAAIGVSTGNTADQVAIKTPDWLAVFDNADPYDNATSTVPDTAACFAVNSTYLWTSAALGQGWTNATYGTGWTTFSGYRNVGYKRFGDIVFLRGVAQHSGSGTGDTTTVFTLPVGYQPQSNILLYLGSRPDASDGAGTMLHSYITINTSGVVTFRGDADGFATFDGLWFSAVD